MKWDNDIYRQKFGFKLQQGLELAAQIKPVKGKLLELGSETGILSYELWKMDYQVEGIEFDSKLVDMARRTTAKSVFFEAFTDDVMLYEDTYPMAIANNVIHRIPEEYQDDFLQNLYNSMKAEGEMAFDMGAAGNDQIIEESLTDAFSDERLQYQGFYYPTEAEYKEKLENVGFKVNRILTIDKTQKLKGEDAMEWYLHMFYRDAFRKVDDDTTDRIIAKVCQSLRASLFDGENWKLPQVRINGKITK